MQSNPSLSQEARAFLETVPEPRPRRTSKDLHVRRKQLSQRGKANATRMIETTGVSLCNTSIGGVRCLQVSPPTQSVDWSILYGFGGGFVEGSALEDLPIIATLSEMTGAKVITPCYRLAPEHPWPAASDDIFAVYQRLARRPLAVVGESAGGNLALGVILRARENGMMLPKAAALLSPWCDLSKTGTSFKTDELRDPTLNVQESTDAAAHYIGRNIADDPRISPIYGAFSGDFPPCIITTGTRDLLFGQATRLAARLRKNGTPVDLRVWDDMWHVFEWYDELPEARRSLFEIATFLSRNMGA